VAPASNTPGTCSWTQSWTVTALDDCGNDAICTVTYTWTVDLVDPVFTSCPSASIPLGCNPAAITNTKAITDAGAVTDNCHVASVTAVAVARLPNTPGTCSWTQSWTVTALDDCGNDAVCTVTYTWTVDLVDPVFTSCPSASIPLGCNPAAITNTKAITDAGAVTDNCHVASVSAVAVGAPFNTPGTCSWTQSWTVTALDDCW
jgi:hypothetical protein